jgi:hypothetical protein
MDFIGIGKITRLGNMTTIWIERRASPTDRIIGAGVILCPPLLATLTIVINVEAPGRGFI